MRTVIYPGSFDPVHHGHLEVIERASRLCDEVVVAVASNSEKNALFTSAERVALLEETTTHISNCKITSFQGLLVDFFRQTEANAVVRGLRAVSDFEYEFQMALMNRSLNIDLETIFLVPSQERIFLSSRIIKEVARLEGDISELVPAVVKDAVWKKFH